MTLLEGRSREGWNELEETLRNRDGQYCGKNPPYGSMTQSRRTWEKEKKGGVWHFPGGRLSDVQRLSESACGWRSLGDSLLPQARNRCDDATHLPESELSCPETACRRLHWLQLSRILVLGIGRWPLCRRQQFIVIGTLSVIQTALFREGHSRGRDLNAWCNGASTTTAYPCNTAAHGIADQRISAVS